MRYNSLEQAIDRGSELCGGQNRLAARLGMAGSWLSSVRHGRKPFTDAQIEALAVLLDTEAADLWLLAQEHRNPFRQSAAGALAAWFLMVLAVILSGTPEPAKASIGAASQPIHNATGIYIVALVDRAVSAHLSAPADSLFRSCRRFHCVIESERLGSRGLHRMRLVERPADSAVQPGKTL